MSNETVYQFKALCFGLSTAPQVFTRVFATVSAWAHSCEVRLLRYLDDWLILASSEAKTRQHVSQLLSLCHSLGIFINEQKSDLSPSRSVEYIGMTIDTISARALPTEAQIQKFLTVARNFLSQRNSPAQLWQVLLGHMSSLEKLVPRVRLRMRSLQWHLKSSWSTESDPPHLPNGEERLPQGDPPPSPPPPKKVCTRTHLGRGGEPASSISQRRDYGRAVRHRYTSTPWK